jgi:hypothetical protein
MIRFTALPDVGLLTLATQHDQSLSDSFRRNLSNEVRLNSRRLAPYVLMLFSVFNAVLWSAGLDATYYGQEVLAKYGRLWASNSDYYITHNFSGYALGIFGLPIFAALIMAEPVRRDFRLEIDALIFSKPVSRAQYLLGKFFGSFFVLVCCQASFAATLILFQVFPTSQMFVLPFRLLPYFKHFMMIVVITYVLFAAVYFTVGTLTRNPKIVYGLAIAYYPTRLFLRILLPEKLTAAMASASQSFDVEGSANSNVGAESRMGGSAGRHLYAHHVRKPRIGDSRGRRLSDGCLSAVQNSGTPRQARKLFMAQSVGRQRSALLRSTYPPANTGVYCE